LDIILSEIDSKGNIALGTFVREKLKEIALASSYLVQA